MTCCSDWSLDWLVKGMLFHSVLSVVVVGSLVVVDVLFELELIVVDVGWQV